MPAVDDGTEAWSTWLAERTTDELQRARDIVAVLKQERPRRAADLLHRWNEVTIALDNAFAASSLFQNVHPDQAVREQVGLFAEMAKDELFTEHVASLCAEHDQLDADLAAITAGDLTRISTMITLLNNHIDREENGLFPAALAYLDDDQWEVIQRPELMEE